MRDPNSRLFLTISVISGFGSTAMMLAAPVWTLDLTGSSSLAAICGMFLYLPTLAGPLLGTIVDRLPRLSVLVWTNLVMAGLLCTLLTVQSRAQLWLIFAVMLANGIAHVLRDAAEAGVLQAAIPAEGLGRLNGMRVSAREGMKLVAPLAGAGIYTFAGGHAVALLDAAALLVAAALYARIRVPAITRFEPRHAAEPDIAMTNRGGPPTPRSRQAMRQSDHKHMINAGRAGVGAIGVLWRHKELRRVVFTCAAAVAMSGFTTAAVYEVVVEDLHQDPAFIGVLGAAQGAGSIAGGLLASRLLDRFGVGAGALLFGLGTGLKGLPTVPIVALGSLIAGIGLVWTVVAEMTAVQRDTPPELVSGVAATAGMVVFAPLVLAIPAGAWLIEVVDHHVALGIAAAATIALFRIR